MGIQGKKSIDALAVEGPTTSLSCLVDVFFRNTLLRTIAGSWGQDYGALSRGRKTALAWSIVEYIESLGGRYGTAFLLEVPNLL